jgi:glyoxylase-like metal-dependent hydrolase (beta-lactamase superfamily II)
MRKSVARLAVVVAGGAILSAVIAGQGASSEVRVVGQMAEALGGRERVLAVKTIRFVGYGELAYQNGGGNITGHPDAPQKWRSVVDYERTLDLQNWRTRVQQRVKNHFVFASLEGQLGLTRTNEVLDGDVAYNVRNAAAPGDAAQYQRVGGAAARQRRMDMLSHPLAIVRAALDPATRLGNLRRQGSMELVDVTLRQGDKLTLAADATTHLPAWISYVAPNVNLGDVTLRVAFAGYVPEKGIQMPTGINTVMDWRNIVQNKIYIDRNFVDEPITDASAPASVRAATPDAGQGGGNANFQPVKVADHVWYVNGTTFFEFDDHLTMFEANRGEAGLQAVVKVGNTLVPGKRVTHVIQSHHHFDHSSGLRAAVAEGLTVISRRGNEGIFREMTSRPATLFPDALGRSPKPLKFMAVDDHLKLKDSTNEVDVYHIIGNYHMADGVIAHVPASRLLIEADLTTQNWDLNWWGDGYLNNIEYRKLRVDTNLAVHAQQPFPIKEVTSAIERQVRNAQALCRKAADAQFFLPGCPIQYNRPLSSGTN